MGSFQDNQSFYELALEAQLQLNDHPQGSPIDYCEVYRQLDPLLCDLLGSTAVVLSGMMLLPVIDISTGRINGVERVICSVEGESEGVYILEEGAEGDPDDPFRRILGYRVQLPTMNRQSPFEITVTEPYAFGPITTSNISTSVQSQLQELVELMPDDDDPIAEEIDVCVSEEKINLEKLNELFCGSEDSRDKGINQKGEMAVEFYESYLNKIFPLEDLSLSLTTNRLLRFDIDHTLINTLDDENAYMFIVASATGFKYLAESNELAIEVVDYDTDTLLYFPLNYLLDFRENID